MNLMKVAKKSKLNRKLIPQTQGDRPSHRWRMMVGTWIFQNLTWHGITLEMSPGLDYFAAAAEEKMTN